MFHIKKAPKKPVVGCTVLYLSAHSRSNKKRLKIFICFNKNKNESLHLHIAINFSRCWNAKRGSFVCSRQAAVKAAVLHFMLVDESLWGVKRNGNTVMAFWRKGQMLCSKLTFSASLRKRRKFLRKAEIFNLYRTYVHIFPFLLSPRTKTWKLTGEGEGKTCSRWGQGFRHRLLASRIKSDPQANLWTPAKKKHHQKVCQFALWFQPRTKSFSFAKCIQNQ